MQTTYTVAPQPALANHHLAIASLTLDPLPPMRISLVTHPKDGIADPNSRTFWSAVANALYLVRQPGEDLFGTTPDFSVKLAAGNDLVAHGRRGPLGCDSGDLAGLGIWAAADQAATADRPSEPVAFHLIGWLPPELTEAAWPELVLRFLDQHSVGNGMVADWAIHSLADGSGGWIRKPLPRHTEPPLLKARRTARSAQPRVARRAQSTSEVDRRLDGAHQHGAELI